MKKNTLTVLMFVSALIIMLTGCGRAEVPDGNPEMSDIYSRYPQAHVLRLDSGKASLDGTALKEFDYTWQVDPSFSGEQFTGTKPDEALGAYIAHDIVYYPEIPESEFSKEEYDGETEWVTRYTAAGLEDYIFGTLPVLGTELPTEMMHSAEEAYGNPVIHITEPGEYIIEGSFNGQLMFDFGDEEDTFSNKDAKAVVIFNGASIDCSVAPAVIFRDVYECDNAWEDRESYTDETDLTDAGVKVIIADGTENNVAGANVYRLLKPEYKKNSTSVQKKLWKTDGAFYSFQSILIDAETKGTGILNITSTTYEGLDSELHLTINGGYINVFSQDDGINVNEDNVSVFTMNGGRLTIFASLGAEGDVVDSNGYIRINGGVIAGTSKSPSDELLDSENGTSISEEAIVIYGGSMSAEGRFGGPGEMRNDRPFDFENGQVTPPDGQAAPPDGFGPGMDFNRLGDNNAPAAPDRKPE